MKFFKRGIQAVGVILLANAFHFSWPHTDYWFFIIGMGLVASTIEVSDDE